MAIYKPKPKENKSSEKGLINRVVTGTKDMALSAKRNFLGSSFPENMTDAELELMQKFYFIRNSYLNNPNSEISYFKTLEEMQTYKKMKNGKPLGRCLVGQSWESGMVFYDDNYKLSYGDY
ncbi:MAG TPA: hypothetical protein PLK34_02350 [Candidatus Pacearchaeota archaeon]|nr:hypothetical protein [Candidatus Pacearchaeota archaeon]